MSRQYIENSGSAVSGPSCSYATLSNYNNGSQGMQAPVPRGNVSGFYIVPAYDAPGYGTLSHDAAPSCSGYFDIDSAYRNKSGNCNQQYIRKLCQ
jgi:hypothetical protein